MPRTSSHAMVVAANAKTRTPRLEAEVIQSSNAKPITEYYSGVRAIVVFGLLVACGGANEDMTVAEPIASQQPQPLPTVSAPPPAPTQEAPPPSTYTVQRSETTTAVNFVEARKHPDAARIDVVIRSAPAWRAFPNIDPIQFYSFTCVSEGREGRPSWTS